MRANYWSCSTFADWLRGVEKPPAATGVGWDQWREKAATAHPIRFWIAEEVLDRIQDIVHYVPDKLDSVRYYINNRWISKSHALTAHPRDIQPGTWCDVGNRFLYCMFNELVDFVEVETAWHHVLWDNDAREKFKTPWWRSGWLRWRTWRCPEAGLEHLEWASNLRLDDSSGVSPSDPTYGTLTYQAINAKEILTLYKWWTVERPARPDPFEASGWSEICSNRRENGDGNLLGEIETEHEKKESKQALNICNQMEKAYEAEDERMMIRLIKVRNSLWT